jgi:prolyl-tRNA editing enzyme YbaK/EbsC (Cys-tRNA(Pro) deacylase)
VLVSGANRVDPERLARDLGRTIERADADRVRAATGFSIGGVAPLGYPAPLETVLDRDLLHYDVVWAAAGTPNAVFPIAPAELVRVSGARVLDVKEP